MNTYNAPQDYDHHSLVFQIQQLHKMKRSADAMARTSFLINKQADDFSPVAKVEEKLLMQHGFTKRTTPDGLMAAYGDYRTKVMELARIRKTFTIRQMSLMMYKLFRHSEQPKTIEDLKAAQLGQYNAIASAIRYHFEAGHLTKQGEVYQIREVVPA